MSSFKDRFKKKEGARINLTISFEGGKGKVLSSKKKRRGLTSKGQSRRGKERRGGHITLGLGKRLIG